MAFSRDDEAHDLLPPLPAWRQELRERVEAYRASHPPPRATRARETGGAASSTEEQEMAASGLTRARPAAASVLPFRHQPALTVLSATGSAEPIADPIPFNQPEPVPEPVTERLEEAREPSWNDTLRPDYLQLPLPMAPDLSVAGGQLPADLAPPGLRLQAGLTDAGVVFIASALFALAGWASQHFAAFTSAELHPLLPALVAVPALLAALYLLLCAYAGGATIGMRHHGLAIRAWDGPLTPAACRRRGWASVVSLGALGLGFFWMLCDRQHLGWHDAISRTCVVMAADQP